MDFLLQFGESKVETLFMRDKHPLYRSCNLQLQEVCTQHAQPGISIGIHNRSTGSSTLSESSWPLIFRKPRMASLWLNLLPCSLSARGLLRRFEYDSRVPRRYRKTPPATRHWVYPRYRSEKNYIYKLTNGHPGVIDEMIIYVRNASEKGSLGQTQVSTSVERQGLLSFTYSTSVALHCGSGIQSP